MLSTALETRGLKLGGDWDKCIAIHESNVPVPPAAELLQHAIQGLACQCKACPSCLSIGPTVLGKKESCSYLETRW